MSKIHYFQRYSSLENTVTNNTLQLFARIYDYSPARAAVFLNRLLGDEDVIGVGLEIHQQKRAGPSVPDGEIVQRPFRVLIESKVDSQVDPGQLRRHARAFRKDDGTRCMLLLTRSAIQVSADITRVIGDLKRSGVIFRNVTFEQVVEALDGLFQDFERSMCDLVEDYADYCRETGLVDESQFRMRIVPCGTSFDVNLRHGVYFHPSTWGYSSHKYLGIYKNKAVNAIWEIDSVFDIELEGDELRKTFIAGRATDEYDDRIRATITDAATECAYEISSGHRFFCGEPHPTYFAKASSGGLMGKRILDLRQYVEMPHGPRDIAEALRNSQWT